MPVASLFEPLFSAFGWDFNAIQVHFWDKSTLGATDAKASVKFNSQNALRYALSAPGELGWARAYVVGEIEIKGDGFYALTKLLELQPQVSKIPVKSLVKAVGLVGIRGISKLEIPAEEVRSKGKRHSKARDSRAISHHYDVGNEFYRLVLGESMTYSCARYSSPEISLEEAQSEKYDLICRKLGLKPGMRLLDVGCGWGGMVLHAVQNYGVTAVGITLSKEQAKAAKQRAVNAGLQNRIEIRIQDYRDINEKFDAISSIGMFEHVGGAQMTAYFNTLYNALNEGGRLLHHAIDKPNGSVMKSRGFVARYVFPDGELQDIATTLDSMQKAGFEARDVESLREHYALTLRAWVRNLETNWDQCVELVGLQRVRIWWLYMVGSAVKFETNSISIHQTIGVKPFSNGNSNMPFTRESYI